MKTIYLFLSLIPYLVFCNTSKDEQQEPKIQFSEICSKHLDNSSIPKDMNSKTYNIVTDFKILDKYSKTFQEDTQLNDFIIKKLHLTSPKYTFNAYKVQCNSKYLKLKNFDCDFYKIELFHDLFKETYTESIILFKQNLNWKILQYNDNNIGFLFQKIDSINKAKEFAQIILSNNYNHLLIINTKMQYDKIKDNIKDNIDSINEYLSFSKDEPEFYGIKVEKINSIYYVRLLVLNINYDYGIGGGGLSIDEIKFVILKDNFYGWTIAKQFLETTKSANSNIINAPINLNPSKEEIAESKIREINYQIIELAQKALKEDEYTDLKKNNTLNFTKIKLSSIP